MWTESSSILCKFGKYICYNFRDIKFFLGGYFFWLALYISRTSNSLCMGVGDGAPRRDN